MTPRAELDLTSLCVIDGGMATELERRGCDISGTLWSAHALEDSPLAIDAVHRSYIEAGADCILTVSYQVSFAGYADLGLPPKKVGDDLRRSVQLAEAARAASPTTHLDRCFAWPSWRGVAQRRRIPRQLRWQL